MAKPRSLQYTQRQPCQKYPALEPSHREASKKPSLRIDISSWWSSFGHRPSGVWYLTHLNGMHARKLHPPPPPPLIRSANRLTPWQITPRWVTLQGLGPLFRAQRATPSTHAPRSKKYKENVTAQPWHAWAGFVASVERRHRAWPQHSKHSNTEVDII